MTITTAINEAFTLGTAKFKITYKLYEPAVPSDKYLLVFHGSGERAVKVVGGKEVNVTDGSMLNLVEKVGYPKAAKNGFEFPFNIIAVQCGVSYSSMAKFVLPWAQSKFGDKLIATGYSLGGIFTYTLLFGPGSEYLKAIAAVCGKVANPNNAPNAVDVPGQSWHGSKDSTVRYSADVNFINKYNASHTNQIELITLDGIGHNAWDKAYSVVSGQDTLLQWIISQFNAL